MAYAQSSIGSATTGNAISARTCLVSVSGTFSATLKIQYRDASGTTHTVKDGDADLAFTAPGNKVLDFGVPVLVWPIVTTYTSGTVVVSLGGSIRGDEPSVLD